MTTTAKKKTVKGVRYTDAQKKEVLDFVASYNAANGRGGQSKAAEKFKMSQITVAAWLKASGALAPTKKVAAKKAAKAPKAPKAPEAAKATKAAKSSKVGTRYTPEQKQEVVDFVASYNAANGRGGQSQASTKFGVSPLTVMAWLKASGAPKASKAAPAAKAPKVAKAPKAAPAAKTSAPAARSGSFTARLDSLVALNRQIEKAEVELAALQSKFASLKASL
ncbi:MAG: hypothetical protein WEB53_12295 [Akkermansiaceae bacterium]